jgi:hypothetical protein
MAAVVAEIGDERDAVQGFDTPVDQQGAHDDQRPKRKISRM